MLWKTFFSLLMILLPSQQSLGVVCGELIEDIQLPYPLDISTNLLLSEYHIHLVEHTVHIIFSYSSLSIFYTQGTKIPLGSLYFRVI